jgi:hypothetical protein
VARFACDARRLPIAQAATHLNEPARELQSVVLTEDAGLDRLSVFSCGEAIRRQMNSHRLASWDMTTHVCIGPT